jgi:hypothetical protein
MIIVGLSGDSEQFQRDNDEVKGWTALLRPIVGPDQNLHVIAPAARDAESVIPMRDSVRGSLDQWKQSLNGGDDAILVLVGRGVTSNNHYRFENSGPRLTDRDFVEHLPTAVRSLTVFVTGPGGSGLAAAIALPPVRSIKLNSARSGSRRPAPILAQRYGSC